MSAEETQIFLKAKGDYVHISPYTQPIIGWVSLGCNLVLMFLLYRIFSNHTRAEKLFLYGIITGVVITLVLAFAAVNFHSARLAQFQPMRTFTWINIFI